MAAEKKKEEEEFQREADAQLLVILSIVLNRYSRENQSTRLSVKICQKLNWIAGCQVMPK